MKLITNSGNDRVIDHLQSSMENASRIDMATSELSVFAFGELRSSLEKGKSARLIIPMPVSTKDPQPPTVPVAIGGPGLTLLEGLSGRPFRNRLESVWLAKRLEAWVKRSVELRFLPGQLPQSTFVIRDADTTARKALLGACPLTTEGFGLTPGNRFGLVQVTETKGEAEDLSQWFDRLWADLPDHNDAKARLLEELKAISEPKSPSLIYHCILQHLFGDRGGDLDEDRIIKTATGIKETLVWKKLFRFQRDGVVGTIDKLERLGGCIIADSVGLGKTFEALAIVKYYELRNDRVLVLCPKRLRDNWTLYKANDRRNSLAADRFNYDVLNHTDLSRDGGLSGDIDLANINWGNYDLVVIDESHNFRNKPSHKDRDTRYERLMNKVIRAGVKTRVLMLSATPVNNRLADLKNQISFVTEGDDAALLSHGIPSIEASIRLAQAQFNRWLQRDEAERTSSNLLDMLGFDYFKLLDLLAIARSRKHIEKYYGTKETGRFPERLRPINVRCDVDASGEFPPIQRINDEIRRLHLAVYAPLRYVLAGKQEAYDRKYATEVRGGESFFRQVDREESLIHLIRVNVLKRMESSVYSFALTIARQLCDVEAMIARIDAHADYVEEVDIENVDIDDPAFEPLLVGHKVKVLLADVDLIRWRQDLDEDQRRLGSLLSSARSVSVPRDAKLLALKGLINSKAQNPLNTGNRKILVFTAFADTAQYLYDKLADDVRQTQNINTALVTGTGSNRTTVQGLRRDLASILNAFSPRSKERPSDLAAEGDIDLLIATDCISEGQNLQDCDYLVNYDIHWNPVRIIQRFGRIDRIGSPNDRIQLVNFWPNMELEEYIDLERRVSGRMVLLDISATGEENLIEAEAGNEMNDLEYRRKQLLKLQETVIDLEDLSSGVSIADLTLTDFRIDLARYQKEHGKDLSSVPLGSFAATLTSTSASELSPGVIFCVKAEGTNLSGSDGDYPLHPYYLVQVGQDGGIVLGYTQARQILDHLKRLCQDKNSADASAIARFERITKHYADMSSLRKLLSASLGSITGKREERSTASLFHSGGTQVLKGEVAGAENFEVLAYLAILPDVVL
jgi:hypothetical protein